MSVNATSSNQSLHRAVGPDLVGSVPLVDGSDRLDPSNPPQPDHNYCPGCLRALERPQGLIALINRIIGVTCETSLREQRYTYSNIVSIAGNVCFLGSILVAYCLH